MIAAERHQRFYQSSKKEQSRLKELAILKMQIRNRLLAESRAERDRVNAKRDCLKAYGVLGKMYSSLFKLLEKIEKAV
jgi:hypothetical protein